MAAININIIRIAREFWSRAGKQCQAAYDILGAVNLILPIDIVCLSELSLRKVEQWLNERQVGVNIEVDDRLLHGFILTHSGTGIIFINGTDTEAERRFTVAHETSHFLLDYKIPRDRAIEKLGVQIAEVLDGLREPTIDEQVDGLLSAVKVKPYTHLLEKVGDGSFSNFRIYNSENDADALAVELLAPSAMVVKDTKAGSNKLSFTEFRAKCLDILCKKYQLPQPAAKEYSLRLSYATIGAPSLLDKLGF